MRCIVLFSLLATALGNLQGYSLPGQPNPSVSGGGSFAGDHAGTIQGNLGGGFANFGGSKTSGGGFANVEGSKTSGGGFANVEGSKTSGGGFANVGGIKTSAGGFDSVGLSESSGSELFNVGGSDTSGGRFSSVGGSETSGSGLLNLRGSGSIGAGLGRSCSQGQVLNINGECVEAEISREIYLINAPQLQVNRRTNPIEVPKPKLKYHIVFVKTPETPEGFQPRIVPPPQQKTIVYVLNKDEEAVGPQLIEIPEGPAHKPEVYYVNYKEGDNPQLPIGIDLQSALSNAINQDGQTVGDAEGLLTGGIGEIRDVLTGGEEGSFSGGQLGGQDSGLTQGQVGTQDGGYTGSQQGGPESISPRGQLGGQEGSSIGGQVGGFTGGQIGGQREDFIGSQFRSGGSASTGAQLGGQGGGDAGAPFGGQGGGHAGSQFGVQGGLGQGGRNSGVDNQRVISGPSDLYNAPRFR